MGFQPHEHSPQSGKWKRFIVRLDAHSQTQPGIRLPVPSKRLRPERPKTSAACGISSRGSERLDRAELAAAAGHPIGVGDARYRFTDQAGYVDTVPRLALFTPRPAGPDRDV